MKKRVKKEKPKMTKAVHEGDDVNINPTRGPDRHQRLKLDTAVEALELAGLGPKVADENLVMVIASVPADGPSGTLNVVTARRVLHALEGAGYKITK